MRLQVPSDARCGHDVREWVAQFARTRNVPALDADEFVVAVAEALANAIAHAHSAEPIEVSCWVANGEQLIATVVDHGIGFAPTSNTTSPELPDPLAEGGRGLPIMRRYTDLFSVRSTPGMGTSVILGRYIDPPKHRGRAQGAVRGAR